jgi:hypothetical protein
MVQVIEIGKWLMANWMELLAAIILALNGLIAVALIVPGEQPEKALMSVVNFISKFSRK